ncbi:hypothetical protein FRC0182_00636 [Corynebacterium diphtheriae]|nr:hypothetical protein FRC0182_00636 [Corynebacterium diphtheriae]
MFTKRPALWDTPELMKARHEVLALEGDARDLVEKQLELRALARDARTCKTIERELKHLVKAQRGTNPATRKQLEVIKQLSKTLTTRLQELDGRTDLEFPDGQRIAGNHGNRHTPVGDERLIPQGVDVDKLFPPLIDH